MFIKTIYDKNWSLLDVFMLLIAFASAMASILAPFFCEPKEKSPIGFSEMVSPQAVYDTEMAKNQKQSP